ncbi:MAG: BatD family protein [Elusimicrobiota bacterium]
MNLIGKAIIFLNFIISTTSATSQIVVTATVDKKTVPINESLVLTITISGQDVGNIKPDISGLSDFNIYSSATSRNMTWINGQFSTTLSFIYTLTPKKTGRFIIPKIGIFTGKEKYFTKEIEIEVVPPQFQQQSTQPQQKPSQKKSRTKMEISDDNLVFVTAETDKKSAYVGEQINLSIRFHTAIPIASNPQYYAPTYSNLISEDIPFTNGTEVINGISYYYIEVKTALFGIMPGKATISRASIVADIQRDDIINFDPFDPNFLRKFFSAGASQQVKLETKPIELEIKSLPPAPSDFSNAVGNFFITAKTDQTTVNAGDAINLIVEITGKGNVKRINPPKFNSSDFKLYDTLSSETVSKNKGIIGGTKKITYIISPVKEGDIEIPPIKLVFFNIDTQKYETISSMPIRIKVLKSRGGKAYDFDRTGALEIEKKESDINYIFEKIPSQFYFKMLGKINSFKSKLNSVLILLLIINYFIIRRKNAIISDPVSYAYKNALPNAKKRIKDAQNYFDSNGKSSLSILYDLIEDYISSKLKQNISHLPFEKVKDAIKNSKASFSDQILDEIKSIIEKIEFLNYASGKLDKSEFNALIKQISELLEKIEKEFEK